MQKFSVTPEIDPILLPYLNEADDAASESLLYSLISDHASPVINQIVGYKLHCYSRSQNRHSYSADAEDLHNDAVIKLIYALREHKNNPDADPIDNFRGYTAKIAYIACYDHFRRHNPLRHSLKNKLRHVLDPKHRPHPNLTSWKDVNGEIVGGFVVWRDAQVQMMRNNELKRLLADPHELADSLLTGQDLKRMNLAELMALIFNFVGGPVELDDLVSIVATLQEIRDGSESLDATDEEGRGSYERLKDLGAGVDQEITQRDFLHHVWKEICQLPVQQRRALLLNLKADKGNLRALLPFATVSQIAEVLQIPLEEFHQLWGDLPLEDATIASMLGLTRQQVINLRKTARERLARRMKALEK